MQFFSGTRIGISSALALGYLHWHLDTCDCMQAWRKEIAQPSFEIYPWFTEKPHFRCRGQKLTQKTVAKQNQIMFFTSVKVEADHSIPCCVTLLE